MARLSRSVERNRSHTRCRQATRAVRTSKSSSIRSFILRAETFRCFYYNGRSYLPRVDLLPDGASVGGTNAPSGAELAVLQSFYDRRSLPLSDPLSHSLAAARVQASATPA